MWSCLGRWVESGEKRRGIEAGIEGMRGGGSRTSGPSRSRETGYAMTACDLSGSMPQRFISLPTNTTAGLLFHLVSLWSSHHHGVMLLYLSLDSTAASMERKKWGSMGLLGPAKWHVSSAGMPSRGWQPNFEGIWKTEASTWNRQGAQTLSGPTTALMREAVYLFTHA